MEAQAGIVGFLIGALLMLAMAGTVIVPMARDDQYRVDCSTMVYGKAEGKICQRDGRIIHRRK